MPKAKIASVGCGWVAKRWHLPTIAELAKRGDLDFVAVCDIDENTAAEVGEQTVKYRQITGTKGMIMDADHWTDDFPLRALVNGEMKDIPIEKERHTVDGVDVLCRIVVHTEPEIVYENPFRAYAIDDWNIGTAEEIMSIANAALFDRSPEYGIGGRKDVEMCIALYESSLLGMMPVELPIRAITHYEQMVHDDFREVFGYAPDLV